MGVPLNVSEWMKGYIGFGATDCDAGFTQGIDEGTYFAHDVTIHMDDIDRFVSEPTHLASMDGFIACDKFGGKRPIEGATFNMLVDDKNPALKFMFYRMPFTDGSGARRTMLGHKTIHDDHAVDLLSDITTLCVRIYEGDVPGPDVATPALGAAGLPNVQPLAMGILHIQALDGIRSARSFSSPGSTKEQAARAIAKFGEFYLDRLWKTFGKEARVST